MALQSLERFRGKRDSEALDPAKLQFEAKPGKKCKGCLFDRQESHVCKEASRLAVLAELPDCDHGVVYVAAKRDPRQLALVP